MKTCFINLNLYLLESRLVFFYPPRWKYSTHFVFSASSKPLYNEVSVWYSPPGPAEWIWIPGCVPKSSTVPKVSKGCYFLRGFRLTSLHQQGLFSKTRQSVCDTGKPTVCKTANMQICPELKIQHFITWNHFMKYPEFRDAHGTEKMGRPGLRFPISAGLLSLPCAWHPLCNSVKPPDVIFNIIKRIKDM